MAQIIRAAAISAVSRQLRRPGVPATAAQAMGAATIPAAAVAGPAALPAAPITPVVPVLSVAPVQPELPQSPQLPERAELMTQAAELLREQQALDAAQARLAQENQQLTLQRQELQAAQQQLQDEAAQLKSDAERLGHEEGRQQALRDAAEASGAQVARLNAVVHALSQSKRALLDENQDLLVEIAFAAVCRVLGTAAATRSGLASMVGELIAAERDPETLRVRVHPQDLEQLSDGASGLDPRLVFLADSGIELGGCMIDGARGTLDARLELQLQHLRAALTLVRQQRNQNEAPV